MGAFNYVWQLTRNVDIIYDSVNFPSFGLLIFLLALGGKCGSHRNTKCMYVMVSSSIKQGGWLWRGFLGYCASYVVSVKLCIMVLIIWLFLFLPLPPTVLESSNSTVHLQSPFWLFTLFFLLPNQLSNIVTHSVCVCVCVWCVYCVCERVCAYLCICWECAWCVCVYVCERERESVCVCDSFQWRINRAL